MKNQMYIVQDQNDIVNLFSSERSLWKWINTSLCDIVDEDGEPLIASEVQKKLDFYGFFRIYSKDSDPACNDYIFKISKINFLN